MTPGAAQPSWLTYSQPRLYERTEGTDQPIHAGCGSAARSARNSRSRPSAAERVSSLALVSSRGWAARVSAARSRAAPASFEDLLQKRGGFRRLQFHQELDDVPLHFGIGLL